MPVTGEGMVTLKLRRGDKEKLSAALKVLKTRVDLNTPEVLAKAGQIGVGYCKLNCPVITNRLRASIGMPSKGGVFEMVTTGRGMGVMFGTAVHYAIYVEEGVDPHGNNPGFRGRHYMLKGVQQAVSPMVDVLTGVIRV